MYRIFQATKDAYITDRIISKKRKYQANTGKAGTLDIYKLYGINRSGSTDLIELTRGLIKFDIDSIKSLYNSGSIDIASPSFKTYIKLFDVYGGQTTPTNYKLILYPLSRSFDEGIGRDVTYYTDNDVCNFLTASFDSDTSTYSMWFMSGANAKGLLGSSDIDVIASGNIGNGIQNLFVTQSFVDGTENLFMDLTNLVSASIVGLLPDNGFRLSLFDAYENNNKSYFVKRFATKDCVSHELRPQLIMKYDDSRNDTGEYRFDVNETKFFYNRTRSGLTNLMSGTTQLTGSNCVLLRLEAQHSGSIYEFQFSGSQYLFNNAYAPGTYVATANISAADPIVSTIIRASGSFRVREIWSTIDKSIAFYSSSYVYFEMPIAGPYNPTLKEYKVSAYNCKATYNQSETHIIKVFCQEKNHTHMFRRIPFLSPSDFTTEAHYSIRDYVTNEVIIPFDREHLSTKMSNDANELYFTLYPGDLPKGRSYVIDVLLIDGNVEYTHRNVGSVFTIMND